jgi:hypothetical protein
MSFDIKTIVSAWAISINPNPSQKELAEKRWDVCSTCPSKVETLKGKKWSFRCSECGCPLSKKVFANNFDECPLGKWKDIDDPYFNSNQKNTKTII